MTTQEMQSEYNRKVELLDRMLDEEIIDEGAFEALLNRVKNETFFAIDVLCDIAQLPVTTAH